MHLGRRFIIQPWIVESYALSLVYRKSNMQESFYAMSSYTMKWTRLRA